MLEFLAFKNQLSSWNSELEVVWMSLSHGYQTWSLTMNTPFYFNIITVKVVLTPTSRLQNWIWCIPCLSTFLCWHLIIQTCLVLCLFFSSYSCGIVHFMVGGVQLLLPQNFSIFDLAFFGMHDMCGNLCFESFCVGNFCICVIHHNVLKKF